MKIIIISILLLETLMFQSGCTKKDGIDKIDESGGNIIELTPTPRGTNTSRPTETPNPTEFPTPTEKVEKTPAPVTNVYEAVNRLNISSKASHVFIVVQKGNTVKCDFYAFAKKGDSFKSIFHVEGVVGKNGIKGKEEKVEGDYSTPDGVYTFGRCFGIKDGSNFSPLGYTVVDENDYWDSNPESKTYNQWVKEEDLPKNVDKSKYEHLISQKELYNYVAEINYNVNPVVKGKGSAIFLHCTRVNSNYTAGCVAIPEEYMIQALKMVYKDSYIVIVKSFSDLLSYVN